MKMNTFVYLSLAIFAIQTMPHLAEAAQNELFCSAENIDRTSMSKFVTITLDEPAQDRTVSGRLHYTEIFDGASLADDEINTVVTGNVSSGTQGIEAQLDFTPWGNDRATLIVHHSIGELTIGEGIGQNVTRDMNCIFK